MPPLNYEIPEISGWIYDPAVPLNNVETNPQLSAWLREGVSQETYEGAVRQVTQDCAARSSFNCLASGLRLNQILKIANSDVINDEANLSDLVLAGQAAQRVTDANNVNPDPEIGMGNQPLGTLLTPYLLIKWGDVILHNSFPAEQVGGIGIINKNIAAWEMSLSNSSSESSGSSPDGNTFRMVLNPSLVDANGNKITVQADGKVLDVMFAYPNSTLVRRHSFGQTQLSDHFYNKQQTEITFRGAEWAIQRFGQQRMYASGKWKDMLETAFKSACTEAGILEQYCRLEITPKDYEPSQIITQQIQTNTNQEFIKYLAENIGGCKVNWDSSKSAELTLQIDCEQSLADRPVTADPEKQFKLVDNALWLGEHLVESINISGKIGEGLDGSRSNRCSGYNSDFPANQILTTFKSCGHTVDVGSGIRDTGRDSHYSLAISFEGNEEVDILSPFNGEVVEIKQGCVSSPEIDDKCGDGYGNYVDIKSSDTYTAGQVWRLYFLQNVYAPKGKKVTAGEAIGKQGRSGTAAEYRLGIRIYDSEGNLSSYDKTETLINEYINTLTRDCNQISSGTVCDHIPLVTWPYPGGEYHIHMETKDYPLYDPQVYVLFQEYFDIVAGSGICVDMNGVGAGQCYEPGNSDWVKSCVAVHTHSGPKNACDFWIADGGTSRNHDSAANRPFPDAWPDKPRTYLSPFTGYGDGFVIYEHNGLYLGHGNASTIANYSGQKFDSNPWCGANALQGGNIDDDFLRALDNKLGAGNYQVREYKPDPRANAGGGQYNVSDEDAAIITAWAQEKGLNPRLVAAFIQAESSFNPYVENKYNCVGIFQCCQGPNPECKTTWNVPGCGGDYRCQLDILWDKYIPKQGCNINQTEDLYVCIAMPACLGSDPKTNLETLAPGACSPDANGLTWIEDNGACTCDGIRAYLRRNTIQDERFPDSEGIIGVSGANEDGSPCVNSAGTTALNSPVANSALGGISGIQFQDEVKLTADFGINPRNIYIAPTSPDSTPQYILLANADNTKGYIDFKINTVRLSWAGHWRWSVTATRSGTESTSLPRTLPQPQSYYDWIRYYWYPDPEKELRSFIAESAIAEFDKTTGALLNAIDDEKASQDRRATSDVGKAAQAIQNTLLDNRQSLNENIPSDNENRQKAEAELQSSVQEFITACEGSLWNNCRETLRDFENTDVFEAYRDTITINDQAFIEWYNEKLRDVVIANGKENN